MNVPRDLRGVAGMLAAGLPGVASLFTGADAGTTSDERWTPAFEYKLCRPQDVASGHIATWQPGVIAPSELLCAG